MHGGRADAERRVALRRDERGRRARGPPGRTPGTSARSAAQGWKAASSTRGTQRGTSPRSSAHTSMSVESFRSASSRRPCFSQSSSDSRRLRRHEVPKPVLLRIGEALEPLRLLHVPARGSISARSSRSVLSDVPGEERVLHLGRFPRARRWRIRCPSPGARLYRSSLPMRRR